MANEQWLPRLPELPELPLEDGEISEETYKMGLKALQEAVSLANENIDENGVAGEEGEENNVSLTPNMDCGGPQITATTAQTNVDDDCVQMTTAQTANCAQMQTTTDDYWLSSTLYDMQSRMNAMEQQIRITESATKSNWFSKADLTVKICEAIKDGNKEMGVSRSYIKKYLKVKHNLPDTPHYMRKINRCLQLGIESELFEYDRKHSLFKIDYDNNHSFV